MLPLISLLLIGAVSAENCSHYFDGSYYSRSAALTIRGLPTNLVFNPNTTDLLFTLIDLDSLHNDEVQTKMDQYVLRKGQPIKIENVKGQAAAVDIKNGKVYVATDEGLTVLNDSDQAEFVSMKDEDIVQLFKPAHKDVLYATLFPDNDVYVIDLNTNEKTRMDYVPCAYFMAVDDKDNVFYECSSKYVKMLLKGFQEPVEFVGLGKNSGRAITVDSSYRVILATNDGLYQLRPDNMIPVKLMDLDITPAGIAFDGDNFYISTTGAIYKYSMEDCGEE